MNAPDSSSSDGERLRRLEALDDLLPTLAGALDVREVFDRISAIARRVLPHDVMGLPLMMENGTDALVYAVTGNDIAFPQTVTIPEQERYLMVEPWDCQVFDDIQEDPVLRQLPPGLAGYRSVIRLPLRLRDKFVGLLAFASRQPALYSRGDVLVARRIAEHILVALSHAKLAEEAQRAAEARERAAALETRVKALTAEVASLGGHRPIVGTSASWKAVLKQATQVASTETTVLLLGESGTGKEVVARFIHRASGRCSGPFVALNCAALPEHLLESELFGFERGAFTGAMHSKPGQIEQAAGGVLFLDEVGEMAPSAQAKFLRVLQEREFQRLGGTRPMRANVRVIAATNRDLRKALERGTFRDDLYYRLHVFELRLPPLRERRDDILPLSEAFLHEFGATFGRPPGGISREACQILLDNPWPGNVRELHNRLERAAILCDGGLITGEHLSLGPSMPSAILPTAEPVAPVTPNHTDLRTLERTAIERALLDARYNKSLAARQLGLTRTQLYVRLRRYGLH